MQCCSSMTCSPQAIIPKFAGRPTDFQPNGLTNCLFTRYLNKTTIGSSSSQANIRDK